VRLLADPAVAAAAGPAYGVGDGNFDASKVYDAAAAAGRQWLAPCRKAARPGCGKHYQSPHRLAGLALLGTARGRRLYRRRVAIERRFAHLTGFAGGRSRIDGELGNDLQQNWRAGLIYATPINRRNSLKFSASRGLWARTGNSFDAIGVAWQNRWGGGL